ncbi:MAG: hypothetical protein ABID61_06000 [Candidatus Micrarchaeota archaeon]
MAGHQLQLNPNSARTSPKQVFLNAASPFLRVFGREVATIEISGKIFSAIVPEGTKFEHALDKIIEKHGGGVATLKYEGMEGKEIVAIMVGDRLMVKGEPDKIAKADFSSFGESAGSAKAIAIEESRNSHGGIHFFIGSSGIPIVVGTDGQVFFPNGSEVEVGRNTSLFSVRLVDYNKDANSLSELGNGSLSISTNAQQVIDHRLEQEELAKSHGGIRGDKLILESSKLLIYDILGDRLSTASEYSDNFQVGGFMAPQFDPITIQQLPVAAPFVNVGLVYPTNNQPIQLPMDGSLLRVPYLYVSVFDGRLQDKLRIKSSKLLMDAVQQTGEQLVSSTQTKPKQSSVVFVPYDPMPSIPHVHVKTKIMTRTGITLMAPSLLPTIKSEEQTNKQSEQKAAQVPKVVLESFAKPRPPVYNLGTVPITLLDMRMPKRKKPRTKRIIHANVPKEITVKPKRRRKNLIHSTEKTRKSKQREEIRRRTKTKTTDAKKQIIKKARSKPPVEKPAKKPKTKPKVAKQIKKPKLSAKLKPKKQIPSQETTKPMRKRRKTIKSISPSEQAKEMRKQKTKKDRKKLVENQPRKKRKQLERLANQKRKSISIQRERRKRKKLSRYFLLDLLGVINRRKRKVNGRVMARN